MIFNSLEFLIFFVVVTAFYFLIPQKYRWVLLLIASYYFYSCWNAKYLLLIVISTLIDYCAGLFMGRTEDKRKRTKYLLLSLASNFGLLFAFKYFNFFNDSLRFAFSSFNILYQIPDLQVLLPVGISFYTFQTLSYTIDVYRGAMKPERHPGVFAVYVSFFPQLVAGPIERATNLLPQFFEKHTFDYPRCISGLQLMLWGFFQKVAIADNIANVVEAVYSNPEVHTSAELTVATIAFAFQIFCDFAGYSNIAIGTARILGFELMVNFRRPYFAQSIGEFWKRWHISLSTWFRDYLYIPLGGNRVGLYRWYFNLFAVFLISGLWHGANWTFVVWGALHGFYLVFSIVTEPAREALAKFTGLTNLPTLRKIMKIGTTFVLVNVSWVFFRADNVQQAFYILQKIVWDGNWTIQAGAFGSIADSKLHIFIAYILLMESIHFIQEFFPQFASVNTLPAPLRTAIYVIGVLAIITSLSTAASVPFIYFQF